MQALWSLLVLCLLAAPMRPSEPESREHAQATLKTANQDGMVAPMFRRTSVASPRVYSPFVAPEVFFDLRPTLTTAVLALPTPSARTDSSIVLHKRSRGPPVG